MKSFSENEFVGSKSNDVTNNSIAVYGMSTYEMRLKLNDYTYIDYYHFKSQFWN